MTKRDCVFCAIAEGKTVTELFYEDERVMAFLDIGWTTKGHTLVVWKEHRVNASDLTEEEFAHFGKIFHRTEKVLLKALSKDKAVVLKTGGLVNHFHFHIYPVHADTPWQEIKDMFDKKTRYQPTDGERKDLVKMLMAGMTK